jgi:hypothetical protein
VGDDLLGAQRDLRRALGRQRERLVEAVGVQRLGAAADRGEALQRDAHDVVLGCWAVSVTPPVWVWKRSIAALGSWRRSARA